jgi:hypothetical protein
MNRPVQLGFGEINPRLHGSGGQERAIFAGISSDLSGGVKDFPEDLGYKQHALFLQVALVAQKSRFRQAPVFLAQRCRNNSDDRAKYRPKNHAKQFAK